MKPWRLQECTLTDVRSGNFQAALLPIGSAEAHGLHVPYGSDAFHSTMIADRVCEKVWGTGVRVCLLPTIPYGVQGNTMKFPLNMDARQATVDALVTDIVRSLEHHGIFKLVIVNGHGGNDFKPLLRDLHGRTNVFVSLVDWWKVGNEKQREIFETPGEHADELETSVALALFPELVRLKEAGDGSTIPSRFEAINRGWISIARPWHLVTKDSTHGDPRKATREKGEAYLRIVVERMADFVVQLSRSPMDDRFPY